MMHRATYGTVPHSILKIFYGKYRTTSFSLPDLLRSCIVAPMGEDSSIFLNLALDAGNVGSRRRDNISWQCAVRLKWTRHKLIHWGESIGLATLLTGLVYSKSASIRSTATALAVALCQWPSAKGNQPRVGPACTFALQIGACDKLRSIKVG